MTMPALQPATVTLVDGRTFVCLVLQDALHTQVHPQPHDPDVPSPLWFNNAEVEKIDYDAPVAP